MTVQRTEEEIREQLNEAGKKDFEGLSYSDGVKAALEWVLGDEDISPMED